MSGEGSYQGLSVFPWECVWNPCETLVGVSEGSCGSLEVLEKSPVGKSEKTQPYMNGGCTVRLGEYSLSEFLE